MNKFFQYIILITLIIMSYGTIWGHDPFKPQDDEDILAQFKDYKQDQSLREVGSILKNIPTKGNEIVQDQDIQRLKAIFKNIPTKGDDVERNKFIQKVKAIMEDFPTKGSEIGRSHFIQRLKSIFKNIPIKADDDVYEYVPPPQFDCALPSDEHCRLPIPDHLFTATVDNHGDKLLNLSQITSGTNGYNKLTINTCKLLKNVVFQPSNKYLDSDNYELKNVLVVLNDQQKYMVNILFNNSSSFNYKEFLVLDIKKFWDGSEWKETSDALKSLVCTYTTVTNPSLNGVVNQRLYLLEYHEDLNTKELSSDEYRIPNYSFELSEFYFPVPKDTLIKIYDDYNANFSADNDSEQFKQNQHRIFTRSLDGVPRTFLQVIKAYHELWIKSR